MSYDTIDVNVMFRVFLVIPSVSRLRRFRVTFLVHVGSVLSVVV